MVTGYICLAFLAASLQSNAATVERLTFLDRGQSWHRGGNKKAAWVPKVYVQDFMKELFPHGSEIPPLRALNLTMQALYGDVLSPGDGSGFISNKSSAPSRFQIRTNVQRNFTIGATSKSEDETRLEFDEFALERVMIAKWLKKSIVCGDIICAREADIIVAPSLTFHALMAFGFNWDTIEMVSGDVALQLRYFKSLLALYPTSKEKRYIFVVHSPFVNSSPKGLYDSMFNAVAILPKAIQEQFVIASIESNLAKRLHGIFGSEWSDGAQLQYNRRRMGTSMGGPLLVTMPYPVPLVAPVKWTHSKPPYEVRNRRPFSVFFMGAANKGDGSATIRSHKNKIRPMVIDAMRLNGESWMFRPDVRRGPMTDVEFSVICSDKAQQKGTACGVGRGKSFWELTVNADFCLQPPGDTLTRSHFYVSILSGCIPVVFEGGHEDFESQSPTWWAWRAARLELSTQLDVAQADLWDAMPLWNATEYGRPFFEYSDFAVVVPSVRRLDEASMTQLLQRIAAMPVENPMRFAAMRRNLDRIAPLMLYRSSVDPDSPDAFVAFESLIRDQARAGWAAGDLE